MASPRAYLVVIILIGLAGFTGCGRGSSSGGATGDTHADHEHHVPPHKPPDFPSAVVEIANRHRQLFQHSTASWGDSEAAAYQELLDIVGWLPELAADSDLPKPQWDLVQQSSRALRELYAQLLTDAARQPQWSEGAQQRFDQQHELLQRIAVDYATSFDATWP